MKVPPKLAVAEAELIAVERAGLMPRANSRISVIGSRDNFNEFFLLFSDIDSNQRTKEKYLSFVR